MGAKRLFFALIATVCCLNIAAQVRVVDAEDGTVVPYANIYNASGTFIGTTDIDGILPQRATKEVSLAISHINYKSAEVLIDTLHSGIIALQPITYKLGDVNISTESLDYIRVSTYVRQYQISDSLPASFSEGTYDFYFPRNKGKAKRHIVAAREVMSESILKDDKNASFYHNDAPTMRRNYSCLSTIQKIIEHDKDTIIASNIKGGVAKMKFDYNKKRETCEAYVDSMFIDKPFTFNFLGVHFQFTAYRQGCVFDTSAGNPTFDKLLRKYDDITMRLWFDGKKGHVTEVEQINEMFVTSVGYVSKAQMKEAMKHDAEQKVIVPPDIPALPKLLTDAFDKMVAAK